LIRFSVHSGPSGRRIGGGGCRASGT
jgi:hypothetical protein